MAPTRPPSAALVVIGDEILTGKFRDENSPFAIGLCRARGIDLVGIAVIPDRVDRIAGEVAAARAQADWVFTTGGVGPTHDDVTMAGVARALGRPVVRHPVLEALLRRRMKERANEAALRMAEVPEGAELWTEGEIAFPLVVAENVLVFPGVPALFQAKLLAVAPRLGGVPVLSRRLETPSPEPEIAAVLTEAQARWPQVAIGSYPRFEQHPPRVIVALDSRDEGALLACEAHLLATIEGVRTLP